MKKLNRLFSLSSISVILVTIERFSLTTKIFLPPDNFLRLHELIQMTLLILFTVIIPILILREITDNFTTVKTKRGFLLFLIFIIGIYFYATGNGVHEISSFYLNNYCDLKKIVGQQCRTFFINDFYTGNVFYFVGGIAMVLPLLWLEKLNPHQNFQKNDLIITLINAVIYALAIFAYAAFDKVIVGLIYSLILMVIADILFLRVKKNYLSYPVITYTAATYTIGAIAALIVRFG